MNEIIPSTSMFQTSFDPTGALPPPPPVPVVPTPNPRKRWAIFGGALVAILVVAGVVTAVSASSGSAEGPTKILTTVPVQTEPAQTQIQRAGGTCGLVYNVEDDGRTITIDTKGEDEYSGDSYSNITCVVGALGMPSSLIQRMSHTVPSMASCRGHGRTDTASTPLGRTTRTTAPG